MHKDVTTQLVYRICINKMFEVFDSKYTPSVFNLRYTIHKVHVKTLSTERNCVIFYKFNTRTNKNFCQVL